MNKDFQEMVERTKLHMYLCERCTATFKDEDTPICENCRRLFGLMQTVGAFR